MGNVTVVGSANIDLVMEVARLPMPGETVTGKHARTEPGGKGLNQAVAAARFGAATTFVGSVGEDTHGDLLAATLSVEGIDTSNLVRADTPTGTAQILVGEKGENVIAVATGANAETTGHLSPAAAGADVLLLQLEIAVAAVITAAKAAPPFTHVILNLAPAPTMSEVAALSGVARTVVANETEAAEMTASRDPEVAAARLASMLDAIAIVTLGADGLVVADADGVRRVAAPAIDAVDTVGAGDAFCGVLAAATAEGMTFDDALACASAAGALTAMHPGSAAAMPTRDDVLMLAGPVVE